MNIVSQRIDDKSQKSFEITLNCNKISVRNSFIEFLAKRSQTLENICRCVPVKLRQEQKNFTLQNKTVFLICDQEHVIFKCKRHMDLSVQDRLNLARYAFVTLVLVDMKLLCVK